MRSDLFSYGFEVEVIVRVCTSARSVRKAADAEALAAELGDFFSPLVFDVTDPKAIAAAAAEVRSRIKGRPLLGLVNNAGAQRPMGQPQPELLLCVVWQAGRQARLETTGAWHSDYGGCYTPVAACPCLVLLPDAPALEAGIPQITLRVLLRERGTVGPNGSPVWYGSGLGHAHSRSQWG